ncbi:hypothetical protein T440DRAFT_50984 [Plenodomus tracheiphilus IPT5]|uniref:Uncharacterized protein n=1 Tax=Plenodomus tracheiphilus IPT5 TaxID=1408161 RepID=A0A6A7BA27_9PLEO|nr:hypothetical protein T440DRAFT_50984 [Plenodomus tracheiphilus IPT5]
MDSSNKDRRTGGWDPTNPYHGSRPTSRRHIDLGELEQSILGDISAMAAYPLGSRQSHRHGMYTSHLGPANVRQLFDQLGSLNMTMPQVNSTIKAGAQPNVQMSTSQTTISRNGVRVTQTTINYNGQWTSSTDADACGTHALQAVPSNTSQQHGVLHSSASSNSCSIRGQHTVNDTRTLRPLSIGPRPTGHDTADHSSTR